MSEPEEVHVLHVDDEPGFAEMTAEFLQRQDDRFTVETATSAAEGLDRLGDESFDCIVSDYDMPDMDGIGFLDSVRDEYPDLPFILFTGKGSEEIASDAISVGVTDYLQKGASAGTEQYQLLANRVENAVESVHARRQHQRSVRQFEAVFEDPQMLVGVLDPDGTLRDANRTALEFVDTDCDAVTGEPFWETPWWHDDIRDDVHQWVERAANGEYVEYEADLTDADGNFYSVDGTVRPVTNDGDEIVSLVVSAQDVTDRKQQARALKETNRQLQAVLDTVEAAIFIKDTEGRYQLMNKECRELLGVSAGEDIVGKTDHDFLPDDVAEQYRADDQRVLERGETIEIEEEVPTSEGTQVNLTLKSPFFDDEGEPVGVCAVSTEITDRKRREQALNVRAEAMEASIDGLAILDTDEEYVFVNQAHASIYGYDEPDAFLGESWQMCYTGDEVERMADQVLPVLAEEGSWRGEAIGRRKDGSTFPQELSLSVTDEGGIICVVRDITDQKEYERKLQQQNERLDRFASVVSHDLRNPLHVAQGRLELARAECDSDNLVDAADAVDRCLGLIDDLLALAREGKTVSETDVVQLADTTDRCWRNVATAEATLEVETDRSIYADPNRLQQLLENLLRNAVEHGGDDVTVTVDALDDGFYVEDDGPGIPAEDREAVFDTRYSTTDGGTGLGLNIVREIAEAHGWDITLTEGDNGGARFELTGVEFVE